MIELQLTANASQACMAACRTQVSLHEAINWWSATAECGFDVMFMLSKDRLHLGAGRLSEKCGA